MDRYHRRKLKQDKFAEVVTTSTHWATEHRRNFVIWGVAGLIVVLAVSGFSYRQSNREREANEQLGKAVLTYSAPVRSAGQPAVPGSPESFASAADRLRAANKAFQSVADSYPRTDAGRNAAYMAGVTASETGNISQAQSEFQKVANEGSGDLAALAKLALANLDQSTGQSTEAISLYNQLISHPTNSVSKVVAQLQLASLYEKNDPTAARKLYEEIQKQDKDAGSQIAQQRLASLGSGK